jgi:putative ATP-dependent endonuclease of the OLD family
MPAIDAGAEIFGPVAEALGVVPDSRVKVLFCVEGPTDVAALKCLSRALHLEDRTIPDLSRDERVAFVVLGGGTLKHWVDEHYLKQLRRPEVHIYDSDVPAYAAHAEAVNARGDASWGAITSKYEIESYLHADAIQEAFGVKIEAVDQLNDSGKPVTRIFAEEYSAAQNFDGVMGDNKAKAKLAEKAFPLMTAERIRERPG